MARVQAVKEPISFSEQKITTNNITVSIHTPSQGVNYTESMDRLGKNHQRPLTYREILSLLVSPNISALLSAGLSGKRFYLSGRGIQQNGDFEIDDNGNFNPSTPNSPKSRKARVWAGSQPPILFVLADPYDSRQFNLGATLPPSNLVSVVLGVPIGTPTNTALIPALAPLGTELRK